MRTPVVRERQVAGSIVANIHKLKITITNRALTLALDGFLEFEK